LALNQSVLQSCRAANAKLVLSRYVTTTKLTNKGSKALWVFFTATGNVELLLLLLPMLNRLLHCDCWFIGMLETAIEIQT
jgi:hypothetical protein